MSEEEPGIVVTMRIADMAHDPPKGSRQGACRDCGEPIWIAPSTDVLAAGWEAVCQHCFAAIAEKLREEGEPIEIVNKGKPSPEQAKELDNALGQSWRWR